MVLRSTSNKAVIVVKFCGVGTREWEISFVFVGASTSDGCLFLVGIGDWGIFFVFVSASTSDGCLFLVNIDGRGSFFVLKVKG